MLKSIEEVYYMVDEIVKCGISREEKRGRKSKLTASEAITILIEGHRRHLRTEKQLYVLMTGELKDCFRTIPSYVQFTRTIRRVTPHLDFILQVLTAFNLHKKQQFCIVDSTSLPVAGYNRHKVKWALDSAGVSKNMHGFYQGFKLHIIVNQDREIMSVATTKANVSDIQLLKDYTFIRHIKGILIGDRGYTASEQHRQFLRSNGIRLIAKQRRNMDPYLNYYYRHILKKRSRIECIFGYLKMRLALIFPFLRSHESFLAHVKAAVIAFMFRQLTPNTVLF